MTQQYSQQVSTALQQWETEAQRAEEQEEKLTVSSRCLVDGFDRATGLMPCDLRSV